MLGNITAQTANNIKSSQNFKSSCFKTTVFATWSALQLADGQPHSHSFFTHMQSPFVCLFECLCYENPLQDALTKEAWLCPAPIFKISVFVDAPF